ncbi:MAG: class I SAM-dependent methyltransferase [Dongiaceae bacterium]
MSETDKVFAGSVPALYDRYLGPLLFEPYAIDLAGRFPHLTEGRLLETAAGTGILTRALDRALPRDIQIVATDLNQPMIDHAAGQLSSSRVTWRQADALDLPFEDTVFDAVICQFGAMFFPDKVKAYEEVRRVLKPGGRFVFNVWDRIEENEFAHLVTGALTDLFPRNPPLFLARTPHGHHDLATIRDEIRQAGFTKLTCETLACRSRAGSPRDPAIGYCQGTPLRNEIEARDAGRLAEATAAASEAIAARFGAGPVDGKIHAHIIVAGGGGRGRDGWASIPSLMPGSHR